MSLACQMPVPVMLKFVTFGITNANKPVRNCGGGGILCVFGGGAVVSMTTTFVADGGCDVEPPRLPSCCINDDQNVAGVGTDGTNDDKSSGCCI